MQRDDALDVLPKKQKVDSYYVDGLDEAKKKLAKFKKTPKKEMLIQLKDEIEKTNKDYKTQNQKREEERLTMKSNYENMLNKVNAWTPPTKHHENLKLFMIEQINSSIGWDCGSSTYSDPLITESPSKYYNTKLKDLEYDVERYQRHYDEELKKVEFNNKWIEDLYKSL
jgi:hypothetical protein